MTRRTAFVTAPATAAVLLAGGCSSSSPGSSSAGSSTTRAASGTASAAPSTAASSGAAATAVDFCRVLTLAEVAKVVGGSVTRRDDGLGSCIYSADDLAVSAPTIGDLTEAGGGYAALRSGSTSAITGTARTLTDVGDDAFVVAGKLSGFTSAQAGASVSGHLVLVTMSPGRGVPLATLGAQAEAVLRLAVTKL